MSMTRRLLPWLAALGLATVAASPSGAVTFPDVLEMLEAEVGEEIILRQIYRDRTVFRLDSAEIIDLKKAGASDRLIEELLRLEEDAIYETQSEATPRSTDDEWNSDFGAWSSGYESGYDNGYDGGYETAYSSQYRHDYDPFGYHWYSAPVYYAYYYPFRTWDVGIYFAGWHSTRWWGWHSFHNWYWWNYCYTHYPKHVYYTHHNDHYGQSYGHYDRYKDRGRSWTRGNDAGIRDRYVTDRSDRTRTRTYGDRDTRTRDDRRTWTRGDRTRSRPEARPDRGSTRTRPEARPDRGRTRYEPPDRSNAPSKPSRPDVRSNPSRSKSNPPSSNRSGGSSGGRSRGGWNR